MLHETSNYYYRFFDEIESRLDFIFYHPEFDYLEQLKIKHSAKLFGINRNGVPDFSEQFEFFNSGVDFKGANYVEAGSYYYRAGDINEDNILEITADTKLIPDTFVTDKTPQLDEGDVLIVKDGATTGKIGIVKSDIPISPFNTHLFKLKPKTEKIDNIFLYYYLQTRIAQDQIQKYITGSAQGGITLDAIANVFLIAPSKEKQKEIVKNITPIVKEVENLKSKAKELQSKAEQFLLIEIGINNPESPNYFFKSGAEKQTLTFDVFPDAIDDRLHYLYLHPKYKALEEVKAKFKTVSLESICTKAIAPGVQPIYDDTGEIIVLKTVDLKNKYIDYDNALRVSAEFYKANKFAEVHKGEIILAASGYVSMGKVDIYDNDEPALISGELLSFKVNDNYDPYFIAYFLRSHLGQIQIEKYWTGSSGQIHLYDKDVNKFIIPSYESISKAKQIEIAKAIRHKIEDAIKFEQQAKEKQTEAMKLFERLVMAEAE